MAGVPVISSEWLETASESRLERGEIEWMENTVAFLRERQPHAMAWMLERAELIERELRVYVPAYDRQARMQLIYWVLLTPWKALYDQFEETTLWGRGTA